MADVTGTDGAKMASALGRGEWRFCLADQRSAAAEDLSDCTAHDVECTGQTRFVGSCEYLCMG